jgi:hypothetical protein
VAAYETEIFLRSLSLCICQSDYCVGDMCVSLAADLIQTTIKIYLKKKVLSFSRVCYFRFSKN